MSEQEEERQSYAREQQDHNQEKAWHEWSLLGRMIAASVSTRDIIAQTSCRLRAG
jgi:hypothetical protein